MDNYAPIEDSDNWFIGEDRTLDFYCVQGAPIVLTATTPSGGTTLAVEPLEEALADNTVLRFIVPRNRPLPDRLVAVTVGGGGAAAGATTVTVDAITAHLRPTNGAGYRVLNMTGYALEWVVRDTPGGATAHISKTTGGGSIVVGDGLGTGDKATVTIADTDTDDLPPRSYFHTLKRTTADNETVLAHGPALLKEAGTR